MEQDIKNLSEQDRDVAMIKKLTENKKEKKEPKNKEKAKGRK